jgi:hypothetical protein
MNINVNGIQVTLKVGADPELFLKKKGKLISAHNLLPGTKDAPYPVSKGAIQVDGTAAEFNIDPSLSKAEFVDNLTTVMGELKNHLASDITLEALPTAEFGTQYLNSLPPIAIELGCSSDSNAFTSQVNDKPDGSLAFRTGAGHIHIGWTESMNETDPNHLVVCEDVIKLCDLYLGVPSLFLDDDSKRRQLYGKAGAYRAKSYGVEYRVLSNFWLRSAASQRWVYDCIQLVIKKYLGGERVNSDTAQSIVKAINTNDKATAKALLSKFNISIPFTGVPTNATI